ncbi:hypothetical protein CAMRE0001_0007 [Campylobacter rectus RM3267]|uniref:Uncharacterized protein n=1 Tax=Campylobacter rectus RM3267 TaxID=553218 RepID=B9D3F4_CAMRE|nr:hypothetical protein CAMRE0001_0007 [Campylobacter rectus RM3267]
MKNKLKFASTLSYNHRKQTRSSSFLGDKKGFAWLGLRSPPSPYGFETAYGS